MVHALLSTWNEVFNTTVGKTAFRVTWQTAGVKYLCGSHHQFSTPLWKRSVLNKLYLQIIY